MVEDYKTSTGISLSEEQARARLLEKEYEKYKSAKELAKQKKEKEEEEIKKLRKQVEDAKKKDDTRKEYISKTQEKQKLQKELADLKSAKYKAVGQNVKNIFSNIGSSFGRIGTALSGDASQNVTRPSQTMQRQVLTPPSSPTTEFQMPDFNNILRQSGVGMDNPQSSFAPSVRAKIEIRRKSKLKKRMKKGMKKRMNRTIPRIPRIPRSPTVVKQKSFNVNDILRSLPQ